MSKSNTESFIDSFVAIVKGDDSRAQAEKAFRQAKAALKSHISSYEGDIIDLEESIGTCREGLNDARLNYGRPITDRSDYIANLLSKRADLNKAEYKHKSHLEMLDFLRENLKTL